jgi:hypothetical protein
VKLVGLPSREAVAGVALLKDRWPAPWHKRLFGGDFVQVGFIRRNALTAIAKIGGSRPTSRTCWLLR